VPCRAALLRKFLRCLKFCILEVDNMAGGFHMSDNWLCFEALS
jgi:hypothetical protein